MNLAEIVRLRAARDRADADYQARLARRPHPDVVRAMGVIEALRFTRECETGSWPDPYGPDRTVFGAVPRAGR